MFIFFIISIIWEIFTVVETTFEEDVEELEDYEGQGNNQLEKKKSMIANEMQILEGDIMNYRNNYSTVMTDGISRVKSTNNINILNTDISNVNEDKKLLQTSQFKQY